MTEKSKILKRLVAVACPACGGRKFSSPDGPEPAFPKVCVQCGASYSVEDLDTPAVVDQVFAAAENEAVRIADRIFRDALSK
jgi:DNA-directed RNA polymerase subunit RPC12/RpoP